MEPGSGRCFQDEALPPHTHHIVLMFSFDVLAQDGRARAGRVTTSHGSIETPSFVAVGTFATVGPLSGLDLRTIGTRVLIANTYHLHLRPGEETVQRMGGLHSFMGWDGPLMTDSGGFQIFSLGASKVHGVGKIASIFPGSEGGARSLRRASARPLIHLDEDGVAFISYLDGSSHRFTPESVIEIQKKLGGDIIFVLDECTSPLHDYAYTRGAMERTHRWALRALGRHQGGSDGRQALVGIVQGGGYEDLRRESAAFMAGYPFDGYALGGSLGNSKEDMRRVLEWTVPLLPVDKPRHLLGIGEIEDIFHAVSLGIDLMDCITPTLMAGTGTFFVKSAPRFRVHILNARYRDDAGPVEDDCRCTTCAHYSRAYLRHLFATGEALGRRLAAIHNLTFVESLMRRIRSAISQGRLEQLKREWLNR
ncbi:tRNA guanosine(34) transglycosylase Tgt [Thermodesulfobacteriota bacterium]